MYESSSFENNIQLTQHNPIEITSDAGFFGFEGTGTLEDPFLIEGLNITTNADYGIYICSTTKYFVIQNCCIDAYYIGIYVEDVARGTAVIANNICVNSESDNGHGIAILFSEEAFIFNNTCNENESVGIISFISPRPTFYNNTCIGNGDFGIATVLSEDSLILSNICRDNNYGISILGSNSSGCFLNEIENNIDYGIYLEFSDQVFFSNNSILRNDYAGVFITDSNRFHFNYNLFQENYFAIYIDEGSKNGEISYNDFIDNGDSTYSQAYDDGENLWYDKYTKMGNYWSDGIEEDNYYISGSAGAVDLYPLNNPIIMNPISEEDTRLLHLNFFQLPVFIAIVYFVVRRRTIDN